MPQYHDHISQAKSNLAFLENINKNAPDHYDWQVTVCFYAALHLVNAHLSRFGFHYFSHSKVKHEISPDNETSLMRLPDAVFESYESLFSHSRRSRYLNGETPEKKAFTGSIHLAKCIRHVDIICKYFDKQYNIGFTKINIRCEHINSSENLLAFKIIK